MLCANKLETEYSHEQWHGSVRFGKSSVSMTLGFGFFSRLFLYDQVLKS